MKIMSFMKPQQSVENQKIKSKTVENISEKESGLKKMNLEKNEVNEKIYKTLKANDIEPTKEMIQEIKSHFNKLEGTISEKIEALDLMLKKGIEVTFKNLSSIHQTLSESIDYGEIIKNLKSIYQGKENIDYKKILKHLEISDDSVDFIIKHFDLNLTFKENIINLMNGENNSIETRDQEKLKRLIINEPTKFVEKAEFTEELLVDFEKNVNEVLDEVSAEIKDEIEMETDWLPELNHFRKFLVEKTTEKMSTVKIEFDHFKGDNSKIIDDMIKFPEKKLNEESIQKVINNFEKIIMKSDITLYTSMSQEKELIQMASQLEEAKVLAKSNETLKAKEILVKIKKQLDQIDFEPKDSKVKAFMKKDLKELFQGKKSFLENFENQIKAPNKGPRQNLEILRSIGLNHESEVVQSIEKTNEKMPMENIKNILMSLMTTSNNEEKMTQNKSTIDHITGQQLLSKLEVKSNIQQMTLNIPYMAQNKIKSLDLFIQAKKEGEKLDWKNSTLYFVMDLKRYGKTGIKIQSINKVVNMTVKNNSDKIESETRDAFETFIDELVDEGFNKGFIQYYNFDESEKNKEEIIVENKNSIEKINNDFERGFDLKI